MHSERRSLDIVLLTGGERPGLYCWLYLGWSTGYPFCGQQSRIRYAAKHGVIKHLAERCGAEKS